MSEADLYALKQAAREAAREQCRIDDKQRHHDAFEDGAAFGAEWVISRLVKGTPENPTLFGYPVIVTDKGVRSFRFV